MTVPLRLDSSQIQYAYVWRFFLWLLVGILISSTPLSAQQLLSRISAATRADGKGFVVRLHCSAPPDSFRIYQSSPEFVQLAVYHPLIGSDKITMPAARPDLLAVEIHNIPAGIGIDLKLAPGTSLAAAAYRDGNRRDLLVGFTKTPPKDLAILTKNLPPIDWKSLFIRSETPNMPPAAGREEISSETIDSSKTPTAVILQPEVASTPADTTKPPAEPTNPPKSPLPATDSIPIPLVDESYSTLKDRQRFDVVVIDAGHGGKDPGALGKSSKEKDVTLKLALKLGALIRQNMPDVKVVYTRDKDVFVELQERGHMANKAGGDLFISIHCNSVKNRRPAGASFYFLGMHKSEDAYEVMLRENSVLKLEDHQDGQQTELSEEQLLLYELTNRGYMESSQDISIFLNEQFSEKAKRTSRGIHQAGFIVLFYSSMPAVLVELGFISNPEEEKYMTSAAGQAELAHAMYNAVKLYREKREGMASGGSR